MSLRDRLLKVGADVQSVVLKDSQFFANDDFIRTDIPLLNFALSGKFDGGLTSGITSIAAPSKHFKTLFALLMVAAYLKKHPDAVCVFYDNEFGSTPSYFASYGIDLERVIHVPFKNIHQLRSDCYKKLQEIKHGEKVIILVDSLGNAASIKEIDNADKEKDTADMTRAKDIKSFFRIVTPEVRMLEIPMVVVNHTYETQEMYSKTIQSGGCVIAGTKIIMADGTLRNIEDVQEGEWVKTKDGISEVTHTWCPDTLIEGEPECYEIEFEDGYRVICSPEHKFMIDGEWVEAKNLASGDDCLLG